MTRRDRTQSVEPWFQSLQAALRRRKEPQIYLLVSLAEAERLAAGALPARVKRQVARLLAAAGVLNGDGR
jgi:hypothetical protein